VRKCIILILITGIVWAQTGFDKLITKAGTKYWGEYSKVEDKIVYFKPNNALEFQAVPLELIETLKLKDGAVLIQSGRINENTLSFKKFSNEYEKLTIEEKAIYDAKLKGKKYFLYPSLMAVGTPPFFILLEKTTNPKASTVAGQFLITMGYIMASMTISGVITASIFSRMDKIIYPKDLTSEADKRVYKSIHDNKLWMESMKNMTLGTFILVPIFFMFDDFVDL